MTDATINPHKVKALELAVQTGGEPSAVVARANTYHAFLTGTAAPASKPAAATGPASGGKPADKATAAPKPADKATAAPKPADKATAAPKPADKAAKPGAAGANATAPAGDTKAPGGKHTYDDVVKALCDVRAKSGKDDALAILKEDGGVGSVRELKPALYDAVVEGCRNALEGEVQGTGPADDTDDLTAGPKLDDLGMPVD